MPELTLPDMRPRLMNELREWAALRRSTVEKAAVEMIRIVLHQMRGPHQEPPLAVAGEETRH